MSFSMMNLMLQLDPVEAAEQLSPAYSAQLDAHVAVSASSAQEDDAREEQAMTLLARSHTAVEQQLYSAMLTEVVLRGAPTCVFNLDRLMARTHLRSPSTIRRGLAGLIDKLSIEPVAPVDAAGAQQQGVRYRVFLPNDVFARRAGLNAQLMRREADQLIVTSTVGL